MNSVVRLANLADESETQRIEGFVAEQRGSVFQRPLWLRSIEQGTGQRALGLVVERGRGLAGWLPLTDVHSPLFGRALVSSGFAVGGGVLALQDADRDALCRSAVELAQRLTASSIELRGPDAPPDWIEITGKHVNFSADLASDNETQLLAIPRKARAEVRKGLSGELTVTTGSDERERAAHFACYSASVRNLGTPVFPRSLFAAVLDTFGQDADILTVWDGTIPVASVLSLYHQGTVMPYWGGGPHAARNLRANERMYYALMCHARMRGCTRFDFGRSKVNSGAYFFKKNWGFEPEPLAYRSWNSKNEAARNIDPNDEGYSAKIALWKKLPLPIANVLGPWIARGLG